MSLWIIVTKIWTILIEKFFDKEALLWIKQRRCKTKLPQTPEAEEVYQYIERAEKWLQGNTYTNPLIKWETEVWGEIPADFGRK